MPQIISLRERAKRTGYYMTARYAFLRDIPFTIAYTAIFGRIPRPLTSSQRKYHG